MQEFKTYITKFFKLIVITVILLKIYCELTCVRYKFRPQPRFLLVKDFLSSYQCVWLCYITSFCLFRQGRECDYSKKGKTITFEQWINKRRKLVNITSSRAWPRENSNMASLHNLPGIGLLNRSPQHHHTILLCLVFWYRENHGIHFSIFHTLSS